MPFLDFFHESVFRDPMDNDELEDKLGKEKESEESVDIIVENSLFISVANKETSVDDT